MIIEGQVRIRNVSSAESIPPELTIAIYHGIKNVDPDPLLGTVTTDEYGRFSADVTDEWNRIKGKQVKPEPYFKIALDDREIFHQVTDESGWNGTDDHFTAYIDIDPQPDQIDPSIKKMFKRITDDVGVIADRPDRSSDVLETLQHFVTYTPTAYENGSSPSGRRNGSRRKSEVADVVSGALQDILGKRVNTGDVKGLESAFGRVFEFAEEEGKRIVNWKAPSYAVETELGAELTGAQASLYDFLKPAADELKKRVERLRPLDHHSDEDKINSARFSFLAELDDFVSIISRKTPLRDFRIKQSFKRLDEYLRSIEKAFGFHQYQSHIETVEDEQSYTEFLNVENYLNSMKNAWDHFLTKRDSVLLGTKLIKLEQLLTVVSEAVDEVYDAMDAFSFDVEERKSKELDLVSIDGSISVQEIFDWVLYFATEKAPRILKEGGNTALDVLKKEVHDLKTIVNEVQQYKEPAPSMVTTASNGTKKSPFSHPRILQKIGELHGHLSAVETALSRPDPADKKRP